MVPLFHSPFLQDYIYLAVEDMPYDRRSKKHLHCSVMGQPSTSTWSEILKIEVTGATLEVRYHIC